MKERDWMVGIALVVALAAGLGAGYLLWGWPTNWYARDVTSLPASPENDIIRYEAQGWAEVEPAIVRGRRAPPRRSEVPGGGGITGEMYIILVTLLASLISGAATGMPQIRHGQVVIKDDPGGEIYAFADRWDQIKAKGVPVKIDGRCSSSCTMGLSNPNVCVTPRAQFDFHLAYTTSMDKNNDGRWIEGRSYWDRKASEQILRPRYGSCQLRATPFQSPCLLQRLP